MVCFGKRESMKDLIPDRRRRIRKGNRLQELSTEISSPVDWD